MDRTERSLEQLMRMGEGLLLSGAEVSRVEDTLSRMGKACGACAVDVFVITSCIIITMTTLNQKVSTQSKRITRAASTDFLKMERLNDLSRRYCSCPFSEEELAAELDAIEAGKRASWRRYIGSMLAAASFALFFGGRAADGAAAAVGAIAVCFLQSALSDISPNRVIDQLVCSTIVGVVINGMGLLIPLIQTDKVMIGDIMLLIPGIAMTNSIRDILTGDTIFGFMRLVETVLWAGALAAGFMLSMQVMRG